MRWMLVVALCALGCGDGDGSNNPEPSDEQGERVSGEHRGEVPTQITEALFLDGTWANNGCEPSDDGAPCCVPQEIVCPEGHQAVAVWYPTPEGGATTQRVTPLGAEPPSDEHYLTWEACISGPMADDAFMVEFERGLAGPTNSYNGERVTRLGVWVAGESLNAGCASGRYADWLHWWSGDELVDSRCFDADTGIEVYCETAGEQ